MPFLWNTTKKLLTKLKSPSPKHRKHSVLGCSIEKVSLPAFLKIRLSAGMTVEAAIVLPLFLFFFVNLGSAMEMIRLHGNLQLALWDVGNKMCVYGYAAGNSDGIKATVAKEDADKREWWHELGDIALTYTYVKSRVTDYLGEAYLEESPLRYGQSGLQFWESDVAGAEDDLGNGIIVGDTLDIVMTYQVSALLEIPFVRPFRMSNRYYGRLWTGYELTGSSDENAVQDVVYITENAQVYHESRNCTHLKLSISEVSMDEAEAARNQNGGRYKECSKCRKKAFQGTVWISRQGDYYHYDRECSGLKRTIYTIPRQQATQYRPCSRCAMGK
ncbi:MAG: hypothetical protein K2N81_12660 [Acetatifactor sp.]|nr:hypothetical protein [Acetatifactor sp.]